MQRLDNKIIAVARKERTKKLETEMQGILSGEGTGYLFVCPFCNYSSSKNKKGSAKIFEDNGIKSFKCFNCGKWRRI